MSEDPTTPQESKAPDLEVSQQQPEQTIEVKAQAVPEAPKVESAPAKTSPTASEASVSEARASETPAPKAAPQTAPQPSQSQETLDKVSKQAQEYWAKAQPILKEKSIQALLVANRFTNHFLDNIWPKLSKQAIAAVPASAKTTLETQKAKVQPTLDKVQPFWEKAVVPFWRNVVVPNWTKGLNFLRQRLPEPLSKELTNRFMTIVILALAFWVYSFFFSLGSGNATVAKKPVVPRPSATPISQRPMRQIPTQPSPQTAPVIKPSPKPSPVVVASPKPSPVVVASPSPKPSPIIIASPKPSPVVAVSPSPKPVAVPPVVAPKTVTTNPELDLAAIQTQLTSTLSGAGESLINSVQATEANNRLRVTLDNGWYGLSEPDQTQMAQALLEKSQALKFGKFELRDDSGELVARNPLIGSEIIILKRQAES
jgi:hypothetical protein